MDEAQARARIEKLEEETRLLRVDESAVMPDPDKAVLRGDVGRLKEIHVELDRLWDYLRQRQALTRAGQDPAGAKMRDSGTVEGYLG